MRGVLLVLAPLASKSSGGNESESKREESGSGSEEGIPNLFPPILSVLLYILKCFIDESIQFHGFRNKFNILFCFCSKHIYVIS